MKQAIILVFCAILLASVASAQDTSTLVTAINAAFNSFVTSGSYATIASQYGLNTTKPACTSSNTYPTPTGALKTIIDAGTISLCRFNTMDIPFWNSTSKTGFHADLINGILDAWNTQYGKKVTASWIYVTPKDGYFPDLQAAVNAGSCQATVEIVTVTAARAQLVDFACSYTTTTSGFVRGPLEANRTNLTTLAALNDPTVKVSILTGSIYDSPSNGVPNAQQKKYPTETAAIEAVANQEAHAVLMEAPFLNAWIKTNPCNGCKYYDDGKGTQEYAMFVKKSAASVAGYSFAPLILMVVAFALAL